MAKQRVSVKNLRVFGQRIPDAIFRQIADEMLPGTAPTETELKNGKPSKAQMWAAICETDGASRKTTVGRAKELLARKVKRDAADAGYTIADRPAVEAGSFDHPRLPNGEVDYVALVAELQTAGQPSPPIMLCGTCARENCTRPHA